MRPPTEGARPREPGRNDRCPCGSGRIYKACRLTRYARLERRWLAAEQAGREARAEARRLEQRMARDAIVAGRSTPTLRFIAEGKLEQVETAARHLIERHPDIRDGWEFLGHVHDKRGENRDAVVCYRRALEIVGRTPDDFDPGYAQRFVDRIAELDPPQAN